MSTTLELARTLIARPSVTPNDSGCQELIAARLEKLGFSIERMETGGVKNLWARRGAASPLFAFAGHTDVVPTGPESEWRFPPFEATEHEGYLYGRGAADMKGSLAAMITAVETFIERHGDHAGSIAFLITSDEEGPAIDGTCHVIDVLQKRDEHIDYCIIGEPSSRNILGDVVRVGRRGSLNGTLTVVGKQGHVAYPELADNPIHRVLAALQELVERRWDEGFESFPPTSFQVSNIASGTGAENVIPGRLETRFNFRYSPAQSSAKLKEAIDDVIRRHGVNGTVEWRESGAPFYTRPGRLREAVIDAIKATAGITPEESTGGGTSDGRFIAPCGAEVVELGPRNASIHQVNECVLIEDLDKLREMYMQILYKLLSVN